MKKKFGEIALESIANDLNFEEICSPKTMLGKLIDHDTRMVPGDTGWVNDQVVFRTAINCCLYENIISGVK